MADTSSGKNFIIAKPLLFHKITFPEGVSTKYVIYVIKTTLRVK